MGYYIEVPENKGKAQQLVDIHGATILKEKPAFFAHSDKAIICVVDNGLFEAAGYAYDEKELNEFAYHDGRPRTWLVMDKNLACELSGYKEQ